VILPPFQVVLCKDGDGKVGLRVRSINKGVFVCLVAKNSAAAMGGLRFGDQVLQINGENVAGFSEAKVHDIFKKTGVNNIVLAVRDRSAIYTMLHCISKYNDNV
jgi:syntenin-1